MDRGQVLRTSASLQVLCVFFFFFSGRKAKIASCLSAELGRQKKMIKDDAPALGLLSLVALVFSPFCFT